MRRERYGHTDTLCVKFSFFESSSFIVIPNNLGSHASYNVQPHFCVSDTNTIKNAVTRTQAGRRDTVAGV